MIETKPESTQFLNVFIDESGSFRWRTDQKYELTAEEKVDEGEVWLGAEFNSYDEPYIAFGFTNEKTQQRTHACIGSTAIFWTNASQDGYETPLPEIDGLEVEVEGDEWGLRRYFVSDSVVNPVTVSFWRAELRDTTNPESQGGWSEPATIQEVDSTLMRQLVENSIRKASELAA